MTILFFTGWSGAGKSTLANALAVELEKEKYKAVVLDGDHYRASLHKDLGFTEADRRENIRRLTDLALEKAVEGYIVIVAAINPYEDQRQAIKKTTGAKLVYIKCLPEVLIQRDTRGLYKRALLPEGDPGKLHNLTGVNDRYDIPVKPDLEIDTTTMSVENATQMLCDFVKLKLLPAL